MKITILLLIALIFTSFPTKAQDTPKDSSNYIGSHIFTLAPYGLVNKVRIRYEYVASKRFTVGTQCSYFYNTNYFPGSQLVAIGRYYFSRLPAPFGFYVMGQAGLAYHHETVYEQPFKYYNTISYQINPYAYSHRVSSYGVMYAIGIGYQKSIDLKQRWILDIYIGVKGFRMNKNLNDYYVENKSYRPNSGINLNGDIYINNQFTDSGVFLGNELGVGGFINCGINLGYRF